MQICAHKPLYVSKEEVPAEIIEKEKEILRAQARNEGKPEKIIDKMVEGRIEKYYQEVCLLEQMFFREEDKTMGALLTEMIAKIGENIKIRRFVRFERGEGIEKKQENFADEVMKQMK
jgi:elongation factor Ts